MSSSQSPTDKRAVGKALRTSVPRSSHATQAFMGTPAQNRPDPVTLLESVEPKIFLKAFISFRIYKGHNRPSQLVLI